MKRILTVAAIALIAAGMIAMTSCKASEFVFSGESEKLMTMEAKNAGNGASSLLGGLEVDEGEQIMISSDIEKGAVLLEVFGGPEEQSIDELPEPEGDPVMTLNAEGKESVSGEVGEGYYFVRATVTKKATGTARVEVVPAAQAD